jgi:predicted esterase
MSSGDGRARRARVIASVCTVVGVAAMIVAPVVRSRVGGKPSATAPAATSPAPTTTTSAAVPVPLASAVASSVGEQPAAPAIATPESPRWIDSDGVAGKALVFPPHAPTSAPMPVTVMLHGMCGHPTSACRPFVDSATSRGWLVCPQAEDPCGGGTRWRVQGGDDARLVEGSVRSLAKDRAGRVDPTAPRVIVGFSLGGTAAVRIAQASEGQYDGLVVIASQVHPEARLLKRAGVKRVVLAAGDLDMTSQPLQDDARALASEGVDTRFVSLGRYGHGFPPDMAALMTEPMTWVSGG